MDQQSTDGTFIQPKITGYRQLSKEEVALMNEGKALAEQCGAYIKKLREYIPSGHTDVTTNETSDIDPGRFKPGASLDQRWISIGATDLQTGFMSVIRGIAQPTTF